MILFLNFSEVDDSFEQQIATELDALDDINTDTEHNDDNATVQDDSYYNKAYQRSRSDNVPIDHFLPSRRSRRQDEEFGQVNGTKPKPNLHLKQTIAQLNQQALLYAGDPSDNDIFQTKNEQRDDDDQSNEAMRRHDDHVSCEDLLEFSTKTKSKSRGQDSDEVRIMSKVLGKDVTSENCLIALNATDWDVHSAIKLAKLQNILKNSGSFYNVSNCWDALTACEGDVAKAAGLLISQGSAPDYV